MNLYLLTEDEYDSACIVCAQDEACAVLIHPDNSERGNNSFVYWNGENWVADFIRGGKTIAFKHVSVWPPPDKLKVRLIGTALESMKAGIVLYNPEREDY